MANQYYNFYYDPVRQGYDTSTWRTLYGDIAIGGGRLRLTDAAIIHYADILRGDASFSIRIGAPVAGADRKFGFLQYNKNAYAYFKILGTAFTAETSNGTDTTSETITWQTAWTNTNTEFRIKWEGGRAEFYVGGIKQATTADVSISGTPMSLYAHCTTKDDPLAINYIDVQTIQSYLMHTDNDNSTNEPLVFEASDIDITEVVTMDIPVNVSVTDNVTISESATTHITTTESLSDSVTITDAVTVVVKILPVDVSDQLNITENLSEIRLSLVIENEQLNITEGVTMFTDINYTSVFDSITISESVAIEKWTPAP